MSKKVSFENDLPTRKVDHFEEEQERKDQRGVFKLKREIWIQNRKDRRAQMELVAQAESDITKLYETMTNFKPRGLFSSSPVYLEERIKKTKLRIKNAEYNIELLTQKINKAEAELLNAHKI